MPIPPVGGQAIGSLVLLGGVHRVVGSHAEGDESELVALMLDGPETAAAWLKPLAFASMGAGLLLSCLAGWRYTRALVGSAA